MDEHNQPKRVFGETVQFFKLKVCVNSGDLIFANILGCVVGSRVLGMENELN